MKTKKSMIAIVLLTILCFFVLTSCSPASCVKVGNGTAYAFSDPRDFAQKAEYRYSDIDSSYWDYYSVEYDITSFTLYYDWMSDRYSYYQTYKLTDVGEDSCKGLMAHSEGIYYIRQTYSGITEECLFDTVYNTCAYKISGNIFAYFGEWLAETDVGFTDTWLCFDSLENEEVSDFLKICNHFYDKEIIAMFNNYPEAFSNEGGVYKAQDFSVMQTELYDWFCLDGIKDSNSNSYKRITGFNWEITSADAVIDLSKSQNPIVKFKLSAYFPSINKSLHCGGTLKYNNVNNTKLDIPEEVITAWQSYDNYERVF